MSKHNIDTTLKARSIEQLMLDALSHQIKVIYINFKDTYLIIKHITRLQGLLKILLFHFSFNI